MIMIMIIVIIIIIIILGQDLGSSAVTQLLLHEACKLNLITIYHELPVGVDSSHNNSAVFPGVDKSHALVKTRSEL